MTHSASVRHEALPTLLLTMTLAAASCARWQGSSIPTEPTQPLPPATPVDRSLEEDEVPARVPDAAPPLHAEEEIPEAPAMVALPPTSLEGPTRYPFDAVHSPITDHVAQRIREILSTSDSRRDNVFMKVGASETADRRYLRCFWGHERATWRIDLGDREDLRATLNHFQSGRAAGKSPFLRDSVATKVGHSTGWAISGNPSPLIKELRATRAAWAFVSFGTNDLSAKAPAAALQTYVRRLDRLLDRLIAEGVVPIVMGTGPRADSLMATYWSPVYALATRSAAEAQQVPFIDILRATNDLPRRGLVRDGIHGNSWVDDRRGIQPCSFQPEALQYHYNVRNLLSLDALDRARRAARGEIVELDSTPQRPVIGDGTAESPLIIDNMPFVHRGTTLGSDGVIGGYEGCNEDAESSGPERIYRLDIEEATPLRIIVTSGDDVDVDLYLLEGAPSGETCRARDTRLIEGTVAPGTWFLSVDTFVTRRGGASPGEYVLILATCEDDDESCSRSLGGP